MSEKISIVTDSIFEAHVKTEGAKVIFIQIESDDGKHKMEGIRKFGCLIVPISSAEKYLNEKE